MEKVTSNFQRYRECTRHIRNTAYIPRDRDDWDILDDFKDLSLLLFRHLILNKLQVDSDSNKWFIEPSMIFPVVPISDSCPIKINREGQSGYWDHTIRTAEKDDMEMIFIDYFDWDVMDQIDFRYYRVRIIDSKKHQDVVGHDALIETIHADVFYKK